MEVLRTLGAGSGLDTKAIVKALVEAQREPVRKLLDARAERIAARLSALGQFRAGLDGLVAALAQRVNAGAVSPQPRISDPTVLSLALDPGAALPERSVEVRELATAQVLASAPVADATAAIGQGTLTIRFGTVAGAGPAEGFTPASRPDLVITIGPERSSLAGIRDAIDTAARQAGAPVRAELVTDDAGTRLVIRGETGAAQGFLIEAAGDPTLDAVAFAIGSGGLTRTVVARDAEIRLDGVTLKRPTNNLTDVLPGARLTLLRAAPGTPVRVSAARQASELAQVVRDVAGALSQLVALGAELRRGGQDGGSAAALAADSTARRIATDLTTLSTRRLVDGPGPASLAELGVRTARDGTLTVDEVVLARVVTDDPAAVERIVRALAQPVGPGGEGSPLRRMARTLAEVAEGRPGRPGALQREQADLERQRRLLEARMARTEAALTRQFALVDARVGESRRLEAALKLQVDLWRRER
ncbi:MAG: flagellar filament capping protein FliD [Sphingomonadaceae bacterium]|uniref:flagellar filament capping protein FliD n=1 Tax=Thermaurantiacus sp. TaxID=2820283 RepID=UPI00298F2EF4|nr:flagellar filament capping protein FliD [Thermaurantiacus sp.]MCS6987323.1 flagellar filament capping protein FliD [Sphingomonadaceae bacterium]MDW8414544.1 flagellar filament capping protein FliD [Thermaurantiacus sp.]